MPAELAPGVPQVVVMVGDTGGQANSVWREDQGVLLLSDALSEPQMGEAFARWVSALRAGHFVVSESECAGRSSEEKLPLLA